MKTWKVYLLTAPDGKQYVGCTSEKDLCRRWNLTLMNVLDGRKSPLCEAARVYGKEKFTEKILREFSSREEAEKYEELQIRKRKTWYPHGLNATVTGGLLGPTNPVNGDRHGSRTCPEKLARGDAHWSRTNPEKVARGDRSGARTHPETRIGERNGNAKLTEMNVFFIRMWANRGYSQRKIAKVYGISPEQCGRIVNLKQWRHVP